MKRDYLIMDHETFSDGLRCGVCRRPIKDGQPYVARPDLVTSGGDTFSTIVCVYCPDDDAAGASRATGAVVSERDRCICKDICVDHCRACNHSGRDLEEPCIADPDWEPDDDDLARRTAAARRADPDRNGERS